VRACLPTKPAQVFSTLLVSSDPVLRGGRAAACRLRFRRGHLGSGPVGGQGVTSASSAGQNVPGARLHQERPDPRRLKLDGAVVELVRGHVSEHDIGEREVMFPADLVVPPRRTKPRLTEEELRALGDCEPVNGRVYAHGTLGGYVTAKCRCAGCRQWARDYQRERLRVQRAAGTCPARRRWEKSRDPDEPYLDKQLWDRIWARAVTDSGIPFKPTAYQVRHTHASWLIDAGENPKAVMHRLGQADLRTTAIRACARRNRRVSRQAVRRATAPAVTIGRRTAQRRFPSGLCSCPAAQPSI
jgi:hypothetical protein